MTQDSGVRCRNCYIWVDTRDARRCPRCGSDLTALPLPVLPPIQTPRSALQDPAFPQGPDDKTAPLSEFLAAGSVLGGLVMLIVGAAVASDAIILAGALVMFGVTGFFALLTRNAPMRRMLASSGSWLFPRWSGPRDRDP